MTPGFTMQLQFILENMNQKQISLWLSKERNYLRVKIIFDIYGYR